MSAETELWGTFSVADHLRPRPFVADVLLYDMCVVPVPGGDVETQRWREIRRNPDLQAQLLGIMGDLALPIPWSSQRSTAWREKYAGYEPRTAAAAVRDDIARGVEFDISVVSGARRIAPRAAPGAAVDVGVPWTEGTEPNPDDPAYFMTRVVLADEFGSKADRALVRRIPRMDEVEAVVAYGSYGEFRDERGEITHDQGRDRVPVFTFEWSFFVPASSERTDADLLRESVELAHTDEVTAWRAAVQRWRRDSILKSQSDEAALRDMEELIRDYAEAARKRKIVVAARWGCAVVGALGTAVAPFAPPLGALAVFGVGALLEKPEIPKKLEAAAMFHQARKRFA